MNFKKSVTINNSEFWYVGVNSVKTFVTENYFTMAII